MKLSVSLPVEVVQFLDSYAAQHMKSSRSAVVLEAIGLLRSAQLEQDYADAWAEWAASGEHEVWDAASIDGLG